MEREDEIFESVLSQVSSWINTPKVKILNIPRMIAFHAAMDKLLSSIDGDWLESEVTITDCPLETGDITLCFDLSNFVVRDTRAFAETIQEFANFEIYPLLDGNIHFAAIYPQAVSVFENC